MWDNYALWLSAAKFLRPWLWTKEDSNWRIVALQSGSVGVWWTVFILKSPLTRCSRKFKNRLGCFNPDGRNTTKVRWYMESKGSVSTKNEYSGIKCRMLTSRQICAYNSLDEWAITARQMADRKSSINRDEREAADTLRKLEMWDFYRLTSNKGLSGSCQWMFNTSISLTRVVKVYVVTYLATDY